MGRSVQNICFTLFVLFFSVSGPAQSSAENKSSPAAVASAHPLATRAGITILEQGGNAFDAAIAVTAVLAVVEPYSSGIGGGGFYLLHQVESDRHVMIDARERAPLRAHRDIYLVSLSADPVEEVKMGFEILKSLGLRHRGVNIISCPSCARQGFDVIKTVEVLEKRLEHIKTPMSLSIIGCVVNGPGEALMTDVGFTGGGAGSGMVYLAGKQSHKLGNDGMIEHIVEQVEKRAAAIEAETVNEAAE